MASNCNALKKYAPQARLDFIQAMTNRAAQFGITKAGSATGDIQGELFVLNGKAYPRLVAAQRGQLIARIARDGFAQVMEAVAYTWFNRFLAIRYMELHHYFDHGCRVLSHPAGHDEPELLEKAAIIALPGLDRNEIVELKLDGTKDEQIYRKLLIAQCNDLHRSMPFLFEKINDETELLLPENLLQSDSIIRKLVNSIAEPEWQAIEIIGWLYQFYISEKKDQVIGKVVKSEDIPAATQLFTPNWIVKYMVQNSLGAQWLATYPESAIRGGMEYYLAPAEQPTEVQAQLDAITPKQLDPEAITLIDPAVGSGHILVEAYDLFRAIYRERGYTKREAARAILTKNLFGLDIDDRAAQMAGFALLMKACADDRSILNNPPVLNVLALQDSAGLDADALAKALLQQERFEMVPSGDLLPDTLAQLTLAAPQTTSPEAKAIKTLVALFGGAKTFGSLITVPEAVTQSLSALETLLAEPLTGDLLRRQAQADAQDTLRPLVAQARLLSSRYDCVVANPPYMGSKGMNANLKGFVGKRYPSGKSDLFAAFIERNLELAADRGLVAIITMQSWMFLSSYEELRAKILTRQTVRTMAHLGTRAFDSIGGAIVSTTACTINRNHIPDYVSRFFRLTAGESETAKQTQFKNAQQNDPALAYEASMRVFNKIPGQAIAYWASPGFIKVLSDADQLGERAFKGLDTGGNIDKYIHFWWEVSTRDFKVKNKDSDFWYPIAKGGEFRRWYGNNEHVINYANSGSDLKDNSANLRSKDKYFKEGATWTVVSNNGFAVRYLPEGFLFDQGGSGIFENSKDDFSILDIIGSLNNKINQSVSRMLCPTTNFTTGDVRKLPIWNQKILRENVSSLIDLSKMDWDSFETSWDFSRHPVLEDAGAECIADSISEVLSSWSDRIHTIKELEEANNAFFIKQYKLESEISSDVPLREITIKKNPYFRYDKDLDHEGYQTRLISDMIREFISYAVGCMMGRYSLAEPGLIYAHSGGVDFDPTRYGAFAADDDGIIPLTEEQWFLDDAVIRIEEFLRLAWPDIPFVETLATVMDGLNMGKVGEPRAALRAYLSKQFYKDHLQTYKNRPIYWLFSSGKQKAFEALVYLHRYNEGTLARMRTNHVTPLMGKLQQRISDLDAEITASSSSAEKTRKGRDKDKLAKQLIELRAFDEELHHLADQRIALDLNEGVKVNYGKFGNLLAFKEKVCPKKKGEDE
ncbi:BREX-1 system adenine-specific DNA-methyltransferase PglX [Gluconobacter sp. Dm-73]|uniref:BREX-1 system adenine-specific DNA-methyltransferase PglX n=1 Tax=Gluconobacter sp. Dm-73 TaxID=2799802 RepID=UPI001B8AFA07|nr:BREX-1 system adenine-specific DNA-methyltransferase PglX [Gluconobacter sp. Dm-73]MBS1073671.1 BREX-1 system adenine-specific DNA-methyltransferase PglX [Gluconobacter sp. Dm-73]